MPFFTIAPAPLKSINGAFTNQKSCCMTCSQAPITSQYIEFTNTTSILQAPSLNQSTSLKATNNYYSLSPSAPLSLASSSKTGVIELDLSTKKYSPIVLIGSTMLSDNDTCLQDHRAGTPGSAGYPQTKFAANAVSIISVFAWIKSK